MPTLVPGCHFVPRWRMRMLPARTRSPPNFFTPRRLDSESRPLRDEPPAFLCAIVVSCALRGALRSLDKVRRRTQVAALMAESGLLGKFLGLLAPITYLVG